MIWFVHREGNVIAWAGQYDQPGYADEQLDDTISAELQTFLTAAFQVPTLKPTPLAWLRRLAQATQQAIFTAAAQNPALLGLLFEADGAGGGIDVTDPTTQAGVGAMAAAGVITQAEAAVLLAP